MGKAVLCHPLISQCYKGWIVIGCLGNRFVFDVKDDALYAYCKQVRKCQMISWQLIEGRVDQIWIDTFASNLEAVNG